MKAPRLFSPIWQSTRDWRRMSATGTTRGGKPAISMTSLRRIAVSKFAGSVTAIEKDIASERTARATLAADIEGIKVDRARIGVELAERGTEIAELNGRLRAETTRQEDLQQRLATAEAALANAHAEASALNQRHAADVMAEGDNVRKAMAATEAEKAELALRLAALEDDYAALRAENTELRRVAGAEWESDREENRRLRERLNEIAVGVVRLTQAMGSDPTAAPDDDNGHRIAEATRAATPPAAGTTDPGEGAGSLADRLRAVQRAGTRH